MKKVREKLQRELLKEYGLEEASCGMKPEIEEKRSDKFDFHEGGTRTESPAKEEINDGDGCKKEGLQQENSEIIQFEQNYSNEVAATTQRNRLEEAIFVMKMVQNDGNPCVLNEYLSIGSIGAAYNLSSLVSHQITHILCLSSLCRIKYPQQFTYLKLPIQDNSNTDIFSILDTCFEFIEQAKQSNGRVLIHCFQGISRSATILSAYLMKYSHLTLEESLQTIRNVRPIICPNSSFLVSLKRFERQLGIVSPTGELPTPPTLSDSGGG